MRQNKGFRTALLSIGAGTALLSLSSAHAATLAEYDFEAGTFSNDGDLASTASNVSYVDENVLVNRLTDVGNPGTAVSVITRYTTVNEAKLNELRLVVTLTPEPGFALNLDSIHTDFAALAANVNNFTAQLVGFSSLDNFKDPVHFNLATDPTGTTAPLAPGPYSSLTTPGMSFNPGLYRNVTTPVEFRFIAFGNAVQIALIDNLRINGTTTAVPEPTTIASAAAALLLTGRRRRAAQ